MELDMVANGHHFEVLNPIVAPVFVDMVDNFGVEQLPTKMLFHQDAVKQTTLPVNRYAQIRSRISTTHPPRRVRACLVYGTTTLRAIDTRIPSSWIKPLATVLTRSLITIAACLPSTVSRTVFSRFQLPPLQLKCSAAEFTVTNGSRNERAAHNMHSILHLNCTKFENVLIEIYPGGLVRFGGLGQRFVAALARIAELEAA